MFVDFRKAFDIVNHQLIIKKLPGFGIQNHELKWFGNYLTTRCQFVVHGVPQGSILGPILFSMYNNPTDPTLCEWCCPHFFYADSHIGKISTILNKDLKRLQSWTHHNNLCIRHVKIQNVAFGTQQRIASRATLSDGPFVRRAISRGEPEKSSTTSHISWCANRCKS